MERIRTDDDAVFANAARGWMLAEHDVDNGRAELLGVKRNESTVVFFDRTGAEVRRVRPKSLAELVRTMNEVRARHEEALARYAGSFGTRPAAMLDLDDADALLAAGVPARVLLRGVERPALVRVRRLLDSYHEETRARQLHKDVAFLATHGQTGRLKRILPDAPATNIVGWWKKNAGRHAWSETHDRYVAR